MARPWLPPLAEGVGSLALLLVGLAALYDFVGVVPGPLMIMALGLLFGGQPLRRAGQAWLEERREPAALLPEVQAALELREMILDLGQAKVMQAVADVARRRRALPRGDDA